MKSDRGWIEQDQLFAVVQLDGSAVGLQQPLERFGLIQAAHRDAGDGQPSRQRGPLTAEGDELNEEQRDGA